MDPTDYEADDEADDQYDPELDDYEWLDDPEEEPMTEAEFEEVWKSQHGPRPDDTPNAFAVADAVMAEIREHGFKRLWVEALYVGCTRDEAKGVTVDGKELDRTYVNGVPVFIDLDYQCGYLVQVCDVRGGECWVSWLGVASGSGGERRVEWYHARPYRFFDREAHCMTEAMEWFTPWCVEVLKEMD